MEETLLYLLKSAGVLSIFLVVYQLLLRNETSFQANRHFLLGGILASGVLPSLELTRTISLPMQASGVAFPLASGSPSLVEPPVEINGWEIVGMVYFFITAILLLRVGFQLLSLLRLVSGGNQTREGHFRMINTTKDVSPFSFFHWIVLNPELHSEKDLSAILEHEKTHASQWHSADVLLTHLITTVLWFNPFSWWYRKALIQNLEYLADRKAIAAVPKNEYQHTLVHLAVSANQPELANNFYQSLIKKRILMLNKTQKQRLPLWKFGTILPLLLAFVLLFNVKTKVQAQTFSSNMTKISAGITAGSKDENLTKIETFFQKNGVNLDFKNLKRNAEAQIVNIEVSVENTKGESGQYTANDPNGIEDFTIISDEDGLRFTSTADSPKVHSKNLLNSIGEKPLFIIAGKEYSNKSLEGKLIRISGTATSLVGKEAEIKYGSKAKDGVIILERGEILEYRDALRELDVSKGEQQAEFIWISEDSKPLFLSFHTQISFNSEVVPDTKDIIAYQGSNKITKVFFKGSESDPVIVLNSDVMPEDFEVNTLNPEEIASINVLKGSSAEALYGAEAGEKGVLVINTKVAGKNSEDTFYFEADKILINQEDKDSTATQSIKGSKVKFSQGDVLYVLDGKVMDKDFSTKNIDVEDIESIVVLKGAKATDKYGEKAEKGVIEINTKD